MNSSLATDLPNSRGSDCLAVIENDVVEVLHRVVRQDLVEQLVRHRVHFVELFHQNNSYGDFSKR